MVRTEKVSVKTEIKRAFLDMLLQKSYTDITVSDIIKKAQVSRMSFYRNFKSTDDVIESITDDIIQGFNASIVPVMKENDERMWRELLFEIIYAIIQFQKYLDISFREFAKRRANQGIIFSRLQDKVLQAERELPVLSPVEKYTAMGKTNLVFGVINNWALSDMKESPEEIVNILMTMIMKL